MKSLIQTSSNRQSKKQSQKSSRKPFLILSRYTEEFIDNLNLPKSHLKVLNFIFKQTSRWKTYHFNAKHHEISEKLNLSRVSVSKTISSFLKKEYLIRFKVGKHTIYHLNQEIFGEYIVTKTIDNRIANHLSYFSLHKECFETREEKVCKSLEQNISQNEPLEQASRIMIKNKRYIYLSHTILEFIDQNSPTLTAKERFFKFFQKSLETHPDDEKLILECLGMLAREKKDFVGKDIQYLSALVDSVGWVTLKKCYLKRQEQAALDHYRSQARKVYENNKNQSQAFLETKNVFELTKQEMVNSAIEKAEQTPLSKTSPFYKLLSHKLPEESASPPSSEENLDSPQPETQPTQTRDSRFEGIYKALLSVPTQEEPKPVTQRVISKPELSPKLSAQPGQKAFQKNSPVSFFMETLFKPIPKGDSS